MGLHFAARKRSSIVQHKGALVCVLQPELVGKLFILILHSGLHAAVGTSCRALLRSNAKPALRNVIGVCSNPPATFCVFQNLGDDWQRPVLHLDDTLCAEITWKISARDQQTTFQPSPPSSSVSGSRQAACFQRLQGKAPQAQWQCNGYGTLELVPHKALEGRRSLPGHRLAHRLFIGTRWHLAMDAADAPAPTVAESTAAASTKRPLREVAMRGIGYDRYVRRHPMCAPDRRYHVPDPHVDSRRPRHEWHRARSALRTPQAAPRIHAWHGGCP
ncbi:hypothetical protein FQR65_LT20185 [Abscondita terminalis]|nr:hypothetical protein FQR65_LT20185 [Abscondita terminalis]